ELQQDLERVAHKQPVIANLPAQQTTVQSPPPLVWVALPIVFIMLVVLPVLLANYINPPTPRPVQVPVSRNVAPAPSVEDVTYNGKNLSAWNKLIEADPTDGELYFSRGRLYQRRDERINALNDFDKAVALGFKNSVLYSSRADTHVMLNQYKEAM